MPVEYLDVSESLCVSGPSGLRGNRESMPFLQAALACHKHLTDFTHLKLASLPRISEGSSLWVTENQAFYCSLRVKIRKIAIWILAFCIWDKHGFSVESEPALNYSQIIWSRFRPPHIFRTNLYCSIWQLCSRKRVKSCLFLSCYKQK